MAFDFVFARQAGFCRSNTFLYKLFNILFLVQSSPFVFVTSPDSLQYSDGNVETLVQKPTGTSTSILYVLVSIDNFFEFSILFAALLI